MCGDIVVEFVAKLLPALEELQILHEVFRNHLRVSEFEFDLWQFLLDLGAIVEAIGDIALLDIQRVVSESLPVKKGVVSLVSVEVVVRQVGELFAEDATIHVSVRQINYNCHGIRDKFNMRYNELTYHKANPFYKQDYLPDRAWFNRKPKDYPSEIPTGQDYFVDNGRKHFSNHFNHSEIASKNILESPERYPFENRIALDKTYMRNLDTIDIEGASSGTRMNQSIKNKLKAQQELARRYNQSLDMRLHKEKTYDVKRREIAQKQFETLQERKVSQNEAATLGNSRLTQNNETTRPQEETNPETYQPYYVDSNNYGKKYINLLPKPYYAHLQSKNTNEYDPKPQQRNEYERQQRATQESHQRREQAYQPPPQKAQQSYQQQAQMRKYQSNSSKEPEEQLAPLSMNNRHKSNPEYCNAYDAEWNRRREDYLKTMEIDEITRNKLQDKKEFRKYNPTNLSFNLAAQSIVGNNH